LSGFGRGGKSLKEGIQYAINGDFLRGGEYVNAYRPGFELLLSTTFLSTSLFNERIIVFLYLFYPFTADAFPFVNRILLVPYLK